MPESCNSRSLSWLVNSCIPKPSSSDHHHHHLHHYQPVPVPVPEPEPAISSLPDDLLLECLSRAHLSSLPSLLSVSRRFSLLLSSPSFSLLRSSHSLLKPTLLSLSSSTLHFTPIDVLDSSTSHPLPTPNPSAAAVPVGRHVYLLSSRDLRVLDAWTLRSAPLPPPPSPRKKFAAAAVNGRLYVAGGSSRTSSIEMYDPDSSTWRTVSPSSPIRHRYACFGAAAGDLFFVVGGLTLSSDGDCRAAHASVGSIDAFNVRTGAWAFRGVPTSARAVPSGGCVVGACGVGPGSVYVLASNALELSFWRWSWEETRVGRWSRLEPPPVGARGGIGGAVRFGCSAVGEGRMVAVVHVSSRGRRGPEEEADAMNGAVMVYDVAAGTWNRGPDLPFGSRRGACVCVDC